MYPLMLGSGWLFDSIPFCVFVTLFSDADLLKLPASSGWSSPFSSLWWWWWWWCSPLLLPLLLPLECLKRIFWDQIRRLLQFQGTVETYLEPLCPFWTWFCRVDDFGLCCNIDWFVACSSICWYFRNSCFNFSRLWLDSFNCFSTVIGSPRTELASYTPFIFISPSRAACSCCTLVVSSCTLPASFLRRWVGGKSLKSSFMPSGAREFWENFRGSVIKKCLFDCKWRTF